jgi:hypothetical protein
VSLPELLQWLEATPFGAIARESLYGFQILVAMHILGLTLSVGVLLWVDLRMLGVEIGTAGVFALHRALLPWFATGFAIMLISGAALFSGFATAAVENRYFWVKMAAIALAGVNAAWFHWRAAGEPSAADAVTPPPAAFRFAGLTSIALWAVAILCGRMMSYTMF